MYFDSLCAAFARLPQVEALALGGSRAGEQYDEKSDYDLYVYCTEVQQETVRRQILAESCSYMELGNRFWELEDDCVLRNGIPIDILYIPLILFWFSFHIWHKIQCLSMPNCCQLSLHHD